MEVLGEYIRRFNGFGLVARDEHFWLIHSQLLRQPNTALAAFFRKMPLTGWVPRYDRWKCMFDQNKMRHGRPLPQRTH